MRREITKHDLEQVQSELRWVCQHNQDRRPPSVVLGGRDGPETHSVNARSWRQQRNSRNVVSKDICGSVFWQIKLRLIIYFSTHLRSCLEIRPHGSKVKVTSCTCERLVWWTLPRQSLPPASSFEVGMRKNNHSASGLLVVAAKKSVEESFCVFALINKWPFMINQCLFLARRVFLICWTKNKGSGKKGPFFLFFF